MKRYIVLLLMAIVLVQSFSRIWIMTAFYINQSYIAAHICVNRFQPVATCKGSCDLNDKLEKERESEQNQVKHKFQEALVFVPQLKWSLADRLDIPATTYVFPAIQPIDYPLGYLNSIFRPPLAYV